MHGDFRQLSKTIPNESIDLIFTDPPYAAKYVPLYSDLAVIAHNVLKEGGSLVTYVGHYAIPKVIEIMENAGLTYWWPIAVVLSELQDLRSKMCCSMHVELAKIGHYGDSMGDIIKRLLDQYNREKSKGSR